MNVLTKLIKNYWLLIVFHYQSLSFPISLCNVSLALAGYRDSRNSGPASVPSRRCLNTCKTVFKREGDIAILIATMGLFWKRWYLLEIPLTASNLYPVPGAFWSELTFSVVLMAMPSWLHSMIHTFQTVNIVSTIPLDITPGPPIPPPRVLHRDSAAQGTAVLWCASFLF